MTTHNAPSPQSSPRRGEEDNRNFSSHFRERNIIELPLSLARKEINKILLSFESEAIIKIPSPLRERVRVRVKLKRIQQRIPSNRIAINLMLSLLMNH